MHAVTPPKLSRRACTIALVTMGGKPSPELRRERRRRGRVQRRRTARLPSEPLRDVRQAPHVPVRYDRPAAREDQSRRLASRPVQSVREAKDVVTVEQVLNSPMISDPLHRLDCCVVTTAASLSSSRSPTSREPQGPRVKIIDPGESDGGPEWRQGFDHLLGRRMDGPRAFEEAGITTADISYASIYDRFTITVLIQIEDLGFCKKGEGGKFVAAGKLVSGGETADSTPMAAAFVTTIPDRGGMTKIIEAVRQLRGESHAKVQVPNCTLALAHGTGGALGHRHGQRQGAHHGKGVTAWPPNTRNARCAKPGDEPGRRALFLRSRCARQAGAQEVQRLRPASSLPARALP